MLVGWASMNDDMHRGSQTFSILRKSVTREGDETAPSSMPQGAEAKG